MISEEFWIKKGGIKDFYHHLKYTRRSDNDEYAGKWFFRFTRYVDTM